MATALVAIGATFLAKDKEKRAKTLAERKEARTLKALETERQAASLEASQEARDRLRKRQSFGLQSTRKNVSGDDQIFKKTLLGQ